MQKRIFKKHNVFVYISWGVFLLAMIYLLFKCLFFIIPILFFSPFLYIVIFINGFDNLGRIEFLDDKLILEKPFKSIELKYDEVFKVEIEPGRDGGSIYFFYLENKKIKSVSYVFRYYDLWIMKINLQSKNVIVKDELNLKFYRKPTQFDNTLN